MAFNYNQSQSAYPTVNPAPVTSNPSGTSANLNTPAAKTYLQSKVSSVPVTTTPPTTTPPPVDNSAKIAALKSQIADLTGEATTLNNAGLTDTADVTGSNGNYTVNGQGQYDEGVNALTKAMSDYTTMLSGSNPAQDLTDSENLSLANLNKPDANLVKPLSIAQGQAAEIKAQAAPQIANATEQQTNKLNAGLQAIKNQQTLLSLQPNNPANLKSAADLANEQATTQKTLADLDPNSPANQLIQSEIAKNQSDIAQANNFDNTGLSSKQYSSLQTLTDKINSDKQTVNLQNVATAVGIINGLSSSGSSSDDAAILMGFVQALQPGASSVRSAIGPITAMLGSKGAQQLLKAEQLIGNNKALPDDVVKGIVSTANDVYKARQKAYQTYVNNNYITPNVKNLGIPDLADRLGSITNPPEADYSGAPSATNSKGQTTYYVNGAWTNPQ